LFDWCTRYNARLDDFSGADDEVVLASFDMQRFGGRLIALVRRVSGGRERACVVLRPRTGDPDNVSTESYEQNQAGDDPGAVIKVRGDCRAIFSTSSI
jgi:hypothetical protein